MNMIQQKISRTSKSISVFMRIGCVLIALVTFLFVIGMGILSFSNRMISSSLQEAFSVVTSTGSIEVPSIRHLNILLLFAIVQLILLFFLIYILYRIFSDISCRYTPFEEKQVIRIKRVAVLTFIMCIVSSVFDGTARMLLYGSVTLSIDFMWFVLAIVIYCMAYIFDYGCQLQKQSDETL